VSPLRRLRAARFTAARLMACGLLAALLCGCAGKPLPMGGVDITRPSQQLLLVVAEDWQSKAARMQRFERARPDEAWQPVGTTFPVNLGRGGLGWGRGVSMVWPLVPAR